MNRKKARLIQGLAVAILVLVLFASFTFLFHVSRVYATLDWTDSLTAWPQTTTLNQGVHNWTNSLSGYDEDISVLLTSVVNIGNISVYQAEANGSTFSNYATVQTTTFVDIEDGDVARNFNICYNLLENDTVGFDSYFKPIDSVSGGTIMNVSQTVTVSKVVIGDVNRDDTVDISDCILLGINFGNVNGTSDWNLNCVKADWNSDGVIDILDAILMGQHFGDTL